VSQRQHQSAGAGDADGLVEIVYRPLDVVVGLEHGVGVEDELDVGIELACLLPDRRRLADRSGAPDHGHLDAVEFAERSRPRRGSIAAAVVDDNDTPRTTSLTEDRRETADDVAFFVERGNHDVNGRVMPVFVRSWRGRVGTFDQPDHAQKRVRTECEIW
jgi:hypothetical protein